MIRHARPNEDLLPLWQEGFGDGPDFAALFSALMFKPENVMLLCEAPEAPPAAMSITIPCTLCGTDGVETPAGMIYGLATRKDFRGKGYGRAVLQASITDMRSRGMALTVLHPATPALYDFYTPLGFETGFYARELSFSSSPLPSPLGRLVCAKAEEYRHCRNAFLTGSCHLRFGLQATAFQKAICERGSGDLFLWEHCGARYPICAAYGEDGSLFCSEFLVPISLSLHAAAALLAHMPASGITLRIPAIKKDENRFGLVCGAPAPISAYMGFIFD